MTSILRIFINYCEVLETKTFLLLLNQVLTDSRQQSKGKNSEFEACVSGGNVCMGGSSLFCLLPPQSTKPF